MCKSFTKRFIFRNSMESATFKASAITEDHKNIRTNTFTSFTPSWPESYTRSLGVSWSLLSLHAVRRAHQQKGARTPGDLRRSLCDHIILSSLIPTHQIRFFPAQIHAPFFWYLESRPSWYWQMVVFIIHPHKKSLCWTHPNKKNY